MFFASGFLLLAACFFTATLINSAAQRSLRETNDVALHSKKID